MRVGRKWQPRPIRATVVGVSATFQSKISLSRERAELCFSVREAPMQKAMGHRFGVAFGLASSLALGLAALLLAGFVSTAAAQDTMRVRGTIERVEGPIYIVKARDGSEVKVTLMDNGILVAIVKASLADIKPGLFVGATGMPQPDGSQKAIEVHIFPEAMRGTGEGHYPWDLQADSTMTNANVAESVAGVDGQTLTLKYKNGEKKIIVTPQTAVVSYNPGDKADLKPGTKIFIGAAKKQPDGTLQAARINYGKDGVTPPM
jgi:hypothetical protein